MMVTNTQSIVQWKKEEIFITSGDKKIEQVKSEPTQR